ncbi:hypothetical protein BH18THE2_BH18THE2_43290 [soil metagenome]
MAVDDNSTDNTLKIIQEIKVLLSSFALCHRFFGSYAVQSIDICILLFLLTLDK